ncbi:LuxR C-terminal-related transcriptional regulator [Streptosporangium sp. CA-115845]|uniref:helix-turn-helix transcriptional regulator n=1 Tax=Streptosporangium sp. CA-115845 TaxID=3240071 RepID=UPI003D911F55
MRNPRSPWPFTARAEELDLVRRNLSTGRRGIVVTGAAGSGRSRLTAEAVPEAMRESVLVVDDAHLLDDASATLVHELALGGRTRLLVTVREGEPAPEGVSRLWEENLLPRLALAPLTERACAELLARAVGGYVDALTVRRLYRASRGDLRLLRELVVAVHAGGDLSHVSGTWTWRGTPPITARVRELVEETIRDLDTEERDALELIASGEPLGTGVPSAGAAGTGANAPGALVAPGVLERLRARGLVTVDDRLVHPLHGPVLRAAMERSRPGRPSGGRRPPRASALAAECEELAARAYAGRLAEIPRGIGERMAEDDTGWDEPAMPEFCARRARVARLRGETREAMAWSREGLRRSPHHRACLAELAHAAAYVGDLTTAWQALSRGPAPAGEAWTRPWQTAGARPPAPARNTRSPAPDTATWPRTSAGDTRSPTPAGAGRSQAPTQDRRPWASAAVPARTWALAAEGDLDGALRSALGVAGDGLFGDDLFALHDVVRLGSPELVADRLGELADRTEGDLAPLLARHARALARRDGDALDKVARGLADLGLMLHAAEASAHAALVHSDRRASQASRNRASALAGACQGARSSALVNLALPRLTARQRQIVSLAAAGLTNRQIAEQLTVSIRTVANHLCDAYARLGSSDRAGLEGLFTVGRRDGRTGGHR